MTLCLAVFIGLKVRGLLCVKNIRTFGCESVKRYPFQEIYAAPSLSGKRDASTLKEQVQLLKSENPMVRYWAVTGLQIHPEKHLKSTKQEILKAMADSYPPIAVLASAMAYSHFGNKEAEQKLKQFCKSDNMHLALLALNNILYFDEKQTFLETVKEVYETPNRNYNVKAACMDYLGILWDSLKIMRNLKIKRERN